jgi:DMATS type aromatic prenyltransferase
VALKFQPNANDRTLFDFGAERLRSLCAAVAFDSQPVVHLFQRMVTPWGQGRISRLPSWPSHVGDDNTPFEFSLAIAPSPELRFMVEPLGQTPSLRSNADAALTMLTSLASDFDVDLSRLSRIRDLFLPAIPRGDFAVWVAAEFAASRQPHFKVYLNPFAQGRELAPAVVEEALVRLGFGKAWPFVARTLARRGPDLDELMYLSLDVSRSSESRVKVYARHRWATISDLEAAAASSPNHKPGDVTQFLRTVAPDAGEVFKGRAPFTCFAFVEGCGAAPASVTTHFPINGYAPHDGVIQERVSAYLQQVGLPQDLYSRALAACANRPLDRGIGLQSYVSLRHHHGTPRVTVYFPVEAYQPGTVAKGPTSTPPSGVVEIADRFEQAAVSNEPYLRRLRREPAHLDRLSKLMANYQLFVSEQSLRLSATSAAREGDDRALAPGRKLAAGLHDLCGAADPYESVGALLAAGIFHRQMGEVLDEELLRNAGCDAPPSRPRAPPCASDAKATASVECLPDETLEATWRGARSFWRAARTFFNELYALCY